MKLFLGLALALCMAFAANADDKEKVVYEVVKGDKAKVKAGSVVRLRAQGISGTEIHGKLHGDAKMTETHIRQIVNDSEPIGVTIVEFDVHTMKAGKVTLEVTKKAPNEKEPTKTELVITVE